MSSLIDIAFSTTAPKVVATNATDSAPSTAVVAALAPPVDVAGFPGLGACLVLDGSRARKLKHPKGDPRFVDLAVEVVLGPDPAPGARPLVSGTAIPLSLSAELAAGGVSLTAEIATDGAPLSITSDAVPVANGAWVSIAAVVTGDDVVLLVDGVAVARRWRRGLRLATAAGTALVVGARADGSGRWSGRIAAVRVSDDVPAHLDPGVQGAADSGMGEIASLHEMLGGDAGWTGAATGPETQVGTIRMQQFSGALFSWSPSAGVHTVAGAIGARHAALGGCLGPLGLPTSDELSLSGLLDKVRAPGRRGSGLRWDDLLVKGLTPSVARRRAVTVTAKGLRVGPPSPEPGVELVDGIQPDPRIEALAAAAGAARLTPLEGLAVARTAAARRAFLAPDGVAVPAARVAALREKATAKVARAAAAGRLSIRDALLLGPDALVSHPVLGQAVTALREETSTPTLGSLKVDAFRHVRELLDVSSRFDREVGVIDGVGAGYVLKAPRAQQFEHGVIVWSAGSGALELSTDLAAAWLLRGGSDGLLGVPRAAEATVAGGSWAPFSSGALFSSPATGAHEVHGAILDKYQELGGAAGWLGFPVTDEVDVKGVPNARTSVFEHGQILWSPATGAHEVHGAIGARFHEIGATVAGLPTTDELTVGSGPFEIRYSVFEKQVIAWRATDAHLFESMELVLSRVDTGAIDDGIEFFSRDRDAELIVHADVWVNGAHVLGVRVPADGHAGKSIEFDHTPIPIPLVPGGTVRILIHAEDWDLASSNDPLADHDVTYSIDDFFSYVTTGGVHERAGSTSNDSGNAGPDAVTFSYSLAPPFQVNLARTRQDLFWSFTNYGNDTLPREMYAETFADVEPRVDAWDDVTNPLDWAYYKAAYKGVAKGGNCFGFSLSAADTLRHRTGFPEPLSLIGDPPSRDKDSPLPNDPTGWSISEHHGVQKGAAKILWQLAEIAVPGYLDPRTLFLRVKAFTDAGMPILVCMRGKMPDDSSVGHCVLAYSTSTQGSERWILIADPNLPAKNEPDDRLSTIRIKDDGSYRVVRGSETYAEYAAPKYEWSLLPDRYLLDIPLGIVAGPHHTPAWQITSGFGDLLGGVVVVDGSVGIDQVTGGGRRLFGDQRRSLHDRLLEEKSLLSAARSAGLISTARVASVSQSVGGSGEQHALALRGLAGAHAITSLAAALTQPVAGRRSTSVAAALRTSVSPDLLAAAREAWSAAPRAGIDVAQLDPGRRVGWLRRVDQVVTSGVWPELAWVPVEDDGVGRQEMLAHRGALPADFSVTLRGRGGDYVQTALAAGAAVVVSSRIADGARDDIALSRVSTARPGVRVSSDQGSRSFDVSVARTSPTQRDLVGWRATLQTASGAGAELAWTTGRIGATVVQGRATAAAPIELVRGGPGGAPAVSRYTLPAAQPTERLRLRPDDSASPFGAMWVEQVHVPTGELVGRTLVEPA